MSLGNALGYLTVLPIPRKTSVPLLRSVHYFPLIGAAMGSVAVILYLALSRYLPVSAFGAGLITLFALELLSGGTTLQGVAELVQGKQSHVEHAAWEHYPWLAGGRGTFAAAALLLVKAVLLAVLPAEWRTHAVFVLPMVGRCSQTLSFVVSPHPLSKSFRRDRLIARRRVRAGLWSAALLLLLLLFPFRAALPALALFALITWLGLKRMNARFGGLTLQTVSFLAECSEASLLAWLALAARLWR